MRRRDFITLLGGVAAGPMAAFAQAPATPTVGVMMATVADDPDSNDRLQAFLQGLHAAGWTEGRNLRVESRWIGADPDRARAYAAELVRLKPNVILANTAMALQPLSRETSSVSIVFVLVYDPVTSGFVTSLAHPGGNMTGFTLGEFPLGGKMMETLKAVATDVDQVAVLMNPDQRPHVEMWRAIEKAAPSLSVRLTASNVRIPADLEPSIKTFAGERHCGLVVLPSPITEVYREKVITLAAQYRLPAVYGFRSFVASGGLVSYGIDTTDAFRRSAYYVDRILKGAKPSELPVEHPAKVELVINLKTAKALGLTVPQSLLMRADEVIE
jgi:putative ABC transport system substrate-binding protein